MGENVSINTQAVKYFDKIILRNSITYYQYLNILGRRKYGNRVHQTKSCWTRFQRDPLSSKDDYPDG